MPQWYGGSALNPDELAPREDQWESQWARVARWFGRTREIQAKSEAVELGAEDIDVLIAFFQNCYHLRDWIIACRPGLKERLSEFFRQHFEMKACRDICNGFKHKKLKRPSLDPDFCLYREYDHFQADADPLKSSVFYCVAFADGVDVRKYDAFDFARRCFRLWEDFISRELEDSTA